MELVEDFKARFNRSDIAMKLIILNVIVFVVSALVEFAFRGEGIINWLKLPSDLSAFFTQPWSIVTYGFLHSGFFHLLFNMLYMYFLSQLFFNFFGEQRFLRVFVYSVLTGGLLYLLCYNLFPVFANKAALLVGASAGVYGLLAFLATYNPDQSVRFFTFNLKLWWIAAALVTYDLVSLGSGNAGGKLAHLGGAIFGFFYARQMVGASMGNSNRSGSNSRGGDGSWFSRGKKTTMQTVYKNNIGRKESSMTKSEKQAQIDAILDKINASGYESLSKAEKEFLFKAGNS